jgi:hypothetical protein
VAKFPTKLELRELDTPPEGYLATMATKKNPIKEQEIRVAEERHKLALAKIEQKHNSKPAKKVNNG